MAVISVIIYVVLAALLFAEGPSRADGWWRRVAFLALGGLAFLLIARGGIDTRDLLRAPSVFDVVVAACVIVVVADFVGLPLPIARRLGIGLHSREWEFDSRLYTLLQEANQAVEEVNTGRVEAIQRLPRIVARVRSLRAPDEDWAAVRDGFALVFEQYAELLARNSEASAWEGTLALNHDLTERTDALPRHGSRILGRDALRRRGPPHRRSSADRRPSPPSDIARHTPFGPQSGVISHRLRRGTTQHCVLFAPIHQP